MAHTCRIHHIVSIPSLQDWNKCTSEERKKGNFVATSRTRQDLSRRLLSPFPLSAACCDENNKRMCRSLSTTCITMQCMYFDDILRSPIKVRKWSISHTADCCRSMSCVVFWNFPRIWNWRIGKTKKWKNPKQIRAEKSIWTEQQSMCMNWFIPPAERR